MSKKKGDGKKKKEKKDTPMLNLADMTSIPNAEKDQLKQELLRLKDENCYYKDEIFQLNEDIRIETLLNVPPPHHFSPNSTASYSTTRLRRRPTSRTPRNN